MTISDQTSQIIDKTNGAFAQQELINKRHQAIFYVAIYTCDQLTLADSMFATFSQLVLLRNWQKDLTKIIYNHKQLE